VIVGDAWEVYSFAYGEGLRAVISFDHAAANEPVHEGHPHCRRVIVQLPADQIGEDGLPLRSASPKLDEMGGGLIADLEAARVDCRFVGRMTYGGLRELVFQVADVPGFTRRLEAWRARQAAWQVEVRESAGWDFFDEQVRPPTAGPAADAGRRVLHGLRPAGSDMSRPRLLEHFFTGPPAALIRLAARLRGDGFEGQPDDGGLTMSRAQSLDLEEINQVTAALAALGADLGVDYTGWAAAVGR
jgi:hypothetical protein